MISDNYHLNETELHRIVNSAKAATDLSDAVKDLLSAHYEISELRDIIATCENCSTLLNQGD